MCLKKEKFLGLTYLPRKREAFIYTGSALRQLSLLKGDVCLFLSTKLLCLRDLAETVILFAFV